MTFFSDIVATFPVLIKLGSREIRSQYVGSALGLFWQFITPLVLILVFWVVFSVGFRVQPNNGVPFVVWLCAGMAAWFAFADILGGSVHAITGNPHLVKKVVFPVQGLPVVKIINALCNHGLFLIILLALIVLHGLPINWYYLQGFYYLFCLLMLGLGISWIVAALNVFARDVARLVGVLLQIGMWATPILWDINILPAPYRQIFSINPMHYVVQGYRDSFVNFVPFWHHGYATILFWTLTIALLCIGVAVFKRLQPQFADLV